MFVQKATIKCAQKNTIKYIQLNTIKLNIIRLLMKNFISELIQKLRNKSKTDKQLLLSYIHIYLNLNMKNCPYDKLCKDFISKVNYHI